MPAPLTPVLAAHGLRYRPSAVFELAVDSLQLQAGSNLGLVGPNGSGKTTLLRLLALLARPDHGAISLAGATARYGFRGVDQRRQIATVFQRPILLDATVQRNVEAGLRFRGVGRHERRARALHWLDRFGIVHLAGRHARRLSGGETRRVALARALVLEPKLLLLDEPFNDLDLQSRQELQRQLRQVLAHAHSAVVLVTHDLYDGLGLVDQLAVMMDGRLVQQDGVDAVLNRPENRRIADLVGMTNLWPGCIANQRDGQCHVRLESGVLLALSSVGSVGPKVFVGVRPEHIRCSPAGDGETAAGPALSLPGAVVAIEPATPLARITVRLGEHSSDGSPRRWNRAEVFAQALDLPQRLAGLRVGQHVHLTIARQDLHLLAAD